MKFNVEMVIEFTVKYKVSRIPKTNNNNNKTLHLVFFSKASESKTNPSKGYDIFIYAGYSSSFLSRSKQEYMISDEIGREMIN